MKIACLTATYRRADGRSPFYLRRAVESVLAQTHRDWTHYVVGDCYDDAEEFSAVLASYEGERLRAVNLPVAEERERYAGDQERIWNAGGVNAYNTAIGLALDDGFDYVAFLDHDDHWRADHLALLSSALEETGAAWACTAACCPDRMLPDRPGPDRIADMLPRPGGCIKSAVAMDFRRISLRLNGAGDLPADYDLWARLRDYLPEHGLRSIFVNAVSCFYEGGQYERHRAGGTT